MTEGVTGTQDFDHAATVQDFDGTDPDDVDPVERPGSVGHDLGSGREVLDFDLSSE